MVADICKLGKHIVYITIVFYIFILDLTLLIIQVYSQEQ